MAKGRRYQRTHRGTMEERAARLLKATWQTIGYDVLIAVADGDNPETVTMPRDHVIDAVTSCGFMGGYPETHGDDEEACKWLDAADEATQERVLKLAFPHDNYGA